MENSSNLYYSIDFFLNGRLSDRLFGDLFVFDVCFDVGDNII